MSDDYKVCEDCANRFQEGYDAGLEEGIKQGEVKMLVILEEWLAKQWGEEDE